MKHLTETIANTSQQPTPPWVGISDGAPRVEVFYDPGTYTLTYLVSDPATGDAVVIDPVLDYEPMGSTTATRSVEALERHIRATGLRLRAVLETHAHADHLSGSQFLKRRFEVPVVIGERITLVQETFKGVFDLPPSFATDGSQFDALLADGQDYRAGSLTVRALATPGHTPACMTYLVGDAAFTGDALFTEDYGTGRCDFPRGDARALYRSVHERLYGLPEDTRVFVGHDYQPGGRPLRWQTTIGVSRTANVQLRVDTPEEAFVTMRQARDKTLSAPRLLLPSVQVNIDAGRLPPAAPNGVRYLRIPLDLRRPTEVDGTPRA